MKPIYVTKTFMRPLEEYINEIKPLWDSAWVTNNGALHREFEQKVSDYLKVKNLCLFSLLFNQTDFFPLKCSNIQQKAQQETARNFSERFLCSGLMSLPHN